MIEDDDLVPFEFSDFWDEEEDDTDTQPIEPDYIDRQIACIPQYGDDSRWRLASYLDMFADLNPDGSLSNEQREAIDNFVLGYQYKMTNQPIGLDK
ncbi:hypothetical protein [Microcoleus sp. D3_18a_C4]|uniref:hypothetical protein n=1 Tax=Microcoleus sp. D3_18a_C4 TaxID=3055332 RepID=UPI002FCEFFFE